MKYAWLGPLLWGGLLMAGNPQTAINVNSRYTVEAVEISGWPQDRISSGLRREITSLVGAKLNQPLIEDLAVRIRHELHVRAVTHRVLRGDTPEHVKIVFQPEGRTEKFELSVPKFLYHAKQGWSAAVDGTATLGNYRMSAGLVSDGDELAERYAGVRASVEDRKVGSDRLRVGFHMASYHEQWNGATRESFGRGEPSFTSPIYRTRQSFEPIATIVLAGPLTLTVGAGFQRFQDESPAARTEAANAMIAALHYHQRVEGASAQQELDANYSLRAATRALGSDFVYGRHRFEVRYAVYRGRHAVLDDLSSGVIYGRAPLFERFVLGNSTTLRGWNKFDLDPFGGDRMLHNSVEYRYAWFQVFYDTGAVWNNGQAAIPRHAIGAGIRPGPFMVAIAFPLREGRIEPMFMVGMNY